MHHLDLQELPCITLDAGGAVTSWNAQWAAALGDSELAGLRPWLELLHAPPDVLASGADEQEGAVDQVARQHRRRGGAEEHKGDEEKREVHAA